MYNEDLLLGSYAQFLTSDFYTRWHFLGCVLCPVHPLPVSPVPWLLEYREACFPFSSELQVCTPTWFFYRSYTHPTNTSLPLFGNQQPASQFRNLGHLGPAPSLLLSSAQNCTFSLPIPSICAFSGSTLPSTSMTWGCFAATIYWSLTFHFTPITSICRIRSRGPSEFQR